MLTCICGKEIPEGRKYCSPRCVCNHLNKRLSTTCEKFEKVDKDEPINFFDDGPEKPPVDPNFMQMCHTCGALDELDKNGMCYRCSTLKKRVADSRQKWFGEIPVPVDPYDPEPEDDEPEEITETKQPEELYQ